MALRAPGHLGRLMLLSAPVAALLGLAATLLPPSPLRPGRASEGLGLLAEQGLSAGPPVRLKLPGTGLTVVASPTGASVEQFDGGGVGRLPLPQGVRLTRIRIVTRGADFGIELGAGTQDYLTWVNPRGVRLDDEFAQRWQSGAGGLALVPALLLAATGLLLRAPRRQGPA